MRVWAELEGLLVNKYASLRTLLSMTSREAQLTKLSILPLLTTGGLLLAVVMTLWTSVMGMIGCALYAVTHQMILMFAGILLVNLGMFFVLQRFLRYHLRHMGFQKTRQYLKSITSWEPYEQAKETDTRAH